ncbi:MFS transporter [Bifidobacterium sp. ESL0775]|uniref:MFS transporter n=1 Tax=Bifidobacterium sp. ESL0775 TaxID=2983230 RepID=UPI0023F69B97|nr:MFS transporter [Bifidobacterium sp. ESL0775]WEV69203.1 MFS transporter [Bifidobacterium sp. ESL0775]
MSWSRRRGERSERFSQSRHSRAQPSSGDAERTQKPSHPHHHSRRDPITLGNAIGYGVGDIYGGGQLTLIGTYLVLFWTRFCGMSISTAQAVVGLSAIISGVAALSFGILGDNLYRFPIGRRFGRRHLLLMIVPPLILVGVLLWIPGLPFAVYFLVYVLWVTVAQLFASAYNTLPGEMAYGFDDRTKLSTVRLLISGASGTTILLLGGATLSIFGEHRPLGYMIFTIAVTICFALAVLICWKSTWEMSPQEAGFGKYVNGTAGQAGSRQRLSVRDEVRLWLHRLGVMFREYASTLRIAIFRRHLALYLLMLTAGDVFSQTFVFFVIYDWSKSAAFASLLLSAGIISVPLTPLFGVAMTRIGPKRMYEASFAASLVGLAWLFAAWRLVGVVREPWWTVFAVAGTLFFFVAKAPSSYLPWAVFPFIADVDQVVSGKYRASTFSGIQAGFRQLVSGLSAIAVGAMLGFVGFDSSRSAQTLLARDGLGALMIGWYVLSIVVCIIVVRRFNLDKHTDGIALAESARVRAGGDPSDVDPSVRATVEDLTGQPYGR